MNQNQNLIDRDQQDSSLMKKGSYDRSDQQHMTHHMQSTKIDGAAFEGKRSTNGSSSQAAIEAMLEEGMQESRKR